ncbi:hypothetical protein [Parasphingorhabdus sp.]
MAKSLKEVWWVKITGGAEPMQFYAGVRNLDQLIELAERNGFTIDLEDVSRVPNVVGIKEGEWKAVP